MLLVVVVVGHGGRCYEACERKAFESDFCYCEKIFGVMEQLDSNSRGGTRWLIGMIRTVRCVISSENISALTLPCSLGLD